MMNMMASRAFWAALLTLSLRALAFAATPLAPETALVGVSGTAPPTTETFTISSAEDVTVTLTDLQAPAALTAASVVLSQGGAIAGSASLAPPAATASFTVAGASGQYTLYVFGVPGTPLNLGTFTVCVAPKTNPAQCIPSASLSGSIALPSTPNTAQSAFSATLTVTTAGAYTVSFADDQFPTTLQTAPNVGIFQGSQIVATAIPSGTVLNLAAGTYTLLAVAQANPTTQAGLFSLSITGPAGVAPLINTVYPVGTLTAAAQANNPAAQTVTLKVTDFAFPTMLGSVSALVTAGSQVLGTATSTGTLSSMSTFAAPAGTLQLWTVATAGTGAGFYEVDLTSSSGVLSQTGSGVGSGTTQAFLYTTPVLPAGSYAVTAADFQFPTALPTLQFAVAQAGAILDQSPVSSTLNVTAVAGPLFLLATAVPPPSGSGVFDFSVQNAAAQLEFDQTQPVSASPGLFSTQTVNIGASGAYNVSLSDLGFPAPFQSLQLLVSSGATTIGKIIGSSSLPIQAMPGPYQLTFLATPAAMQQFGMYGLSIVGIPAPTVALSALPMSVPVGSMSTLTWTVSNATSCTGTGSGFPANPSASGGSVALTVSVTTTYQITCTGPGGGTASQSVTVTATPVASSRGGGGGLGFDFSAFLILIMGLRLGAKRIRLS
jgi:hypothetical protein